MYMVALMNANNGNVVTQFVKAANERQAYAIAARTNKGWAPVRCAFYS